MSASQCGNSWVSIAQKGRKFNIAREVTRRIRGICDVGGRLLSRRDGVQALAVCQNEPARVGGRGSGSSQRDKSDLAPGPDCVALDDNEAAQLRHAFCLLQGLGNVACVSYHVTYGGSKSISQGCRRRESDNCVSSAKA